MVDVHIAKWRHRSNQRIRIWAGYITSIDTVTQVSIKIGKRRKKTKTRVEMYNIIQCIHMN